MAVFPIELLDEPSNAGKNDASGMLGEDDGAQTKAEASMFSNAAAATDRELKMTLKQGVKLYPKAIAYSMAIGMLTAMEGYDLSLVSNFYAFEPFNKKYGVQLADGTYNIPASWQSALSNGSQCGQVIGLIINGFVAERFGYRKTILVCLIWLAAVTTIFFCAPNIQTLLVGEILAGLPWGVFQSIAVSYAAEVCPVALRGYLTAWVNTCWGIGQLIGIGVIQSMLDRTDQRAYRIPYGLMWMWYPPLIVAIALAPESPWWLVRRGRLADAKKSLLRLTSRNDPTFDVDQTIDMMRHTTELEKDITTCASYLDCFKGVNLRRNELVCMIWATQNLSGFTFSTYSTYFFQQAGLTGRAPYDFSMGEFGLNTIGTFIAWGLMAIGFGRRTLYVGGLAGEFVALLCMGFMGLVQKSNQHASGLATGSLMLIWSAMYMVTVAPLAYPLVAEISTRRLQIKTVALGRAAYNVVAICANVLTPYMVNPTAWNWGNYAGFFWAGICFLCFVYHFFRLPEPTGKSFAEIDILFERKTPARKFKKAHVNAFDVALHHQVAEDKPESQHVENA
ncbi:hypothetical protein EHS25_001637 [Saitozyma podzolica]|uniref:Major facilitator superfamily (MFS) profile domain-containing protein n=1 Tax=Saitozyma podzolica TaxID=1890683 RepID=A0A427YH04_9TREE|nr:hypothetical protein EHS25_001637 [Saitozyma podzolica]